MNQLSGSRIIMVALGILAILGVYFGVGELAKKFEKPPLKIDYEHGFYTFKEGEMRRFYYGLREDGVVVWRQVETDQPQHAVAPVAGPKVPPNIGTQSQPAVKK